MMQVLNQDFARSISNQRASGRQKAAATVVAALLVLLVLVVLPHARNAGPVLQPFMPAFIAAVLLGELITAYLIFSEFLVNRSMPLAVLAAAYLFAGLITVPHLLTFPGVFSETGLLGAGTQTAVWLWVFWHGGFPLFIIGYAAALRWRGGSLQKPEQGKLLLGLVVAGVLAFVLLLTLLALHSDVLLPSIIERGNYFRLLTSGVGPAIWALNALALAGLLYATRGRSALNTWLCVAVLASLLDVTLTLFSGSRYSIGWYAARMNSLLSAAAVLVMLLYKIRMLYYGMGQQERVLRTVFEFAAVGIARVDLNGWPIEANIAFRSMLGYSAQELRDRGLRSLTHPDDMRRDQVFLTELLGGQRKDYSIEKRYYHKAGHLVWGNSIVSLVRGVDDEPEFMIVMVENITKRKAYEEQITFHAYHDALTKLPNRLLFAERLKEAIASAKRAPHGMAVFFLDLDGFKRVNDTLGHDIGDKLLQTVATRLIGCVGDGYTVARMGGDEFTVIVPELKEEGEAVRLAGSILALFREPFLLDGHEVRVSTSIGIALYPEHGEDVQTLMKLADTAMYEAKESGKNQFKMVAAASSV